MRTYGKVLLHKGYWVIPKLEPHVAIKIKSIFERISKTQTENFTFEDTPENSLDLEWFMQRYPLEISEKDKNHLLGRKLERLELMDRMEDILRPDYKPQVINMKIPLRHYQNQAVALMFAHKVLLLGDDVGLGKTATLIGLLSHQECLPAVVVCQTSLPPQWIEQIQKFSNLTVHYVKVRKPYQLPPADVYIFKYSILSGWIDVFKTIGYKTVGMDEIQELRLSDSEKYRAGRELMKYAEYRIGLSATPIYNKGTEIYNIIELLKPGALGERWDFLREWGGYNEHLRDPKALGTYLRENYLFLRRTKEEVGMELEPVNTITHIVEYDHQAIDNINEIAKILAIKVTSGTFMERGQAARDLDIMVRHATGVSKAKYVAAYVKMLLDSGEPVLLVGWHRDVYEIWNQELKDYNPVMYTGSESPAQKAASKKAFCDGVTNLMFMSLWSAVGLDGLQQRCSTVVFGELDWSPEKHKQVIGRLYRDGQTKPVMAIYLISDSGSDPLMVDMLGLKASEIKAVVDPLASASVQFSDEGRIKLLAERILNKQ